MDHDILHAERENDGDVNPAEFPQPWCGPVAGGPISLSDCHVNVVLCTEVTPPGILCVKSC